MSTAKATGGVLDVPIVDIAGFSAGPGAHRERIARQVDRAARTVGFMQITGHGIPELAADGLTEAMDGFFALPFRAEERCPAAVSRREPWLHRPKD